MATAKTERNVALARRGMEAYNRGDIAAVLELFSPDVEVYAPRDFMNAGTFHGHDGFLEWIGHWNEAWESFEIGIERVTPIADRFAVLDVNQVGLGRGSGIAVEQEVTYLYDIHEGRCTYFAIHPDHDTAVADARRRGASA